MGVLLLAGGSVGVGCLWTLEVGPVVRLHNVEFYILNVRRDWISSACYKITIFGKEKIRGQTKNDG